MGKQMDVQYAKEMSDATRKAQFDQIQQIAQMKGVDPRQISNQFGNLTSLNRVIADRRKKRQKDLESKRKHQREALIEKE